MLDLTPATFEEFELQAQRGNVVPVVRSVLADLQPPVGAFLRIGGDTRQVTSYNLDNFPYVSSQFKLQ
jgi:hypothetical protein